MKYEYLPPTATSTTSAHGNSIINSLPLAIFLPTKQDFLFSLLPHSSGHFLLKTSLKSIAGSLQMEGKKILYAKELYMADTGIRFVQLIGSDRVRTCQSFLFADKIITSPFILRTRHWSLFDLTSFTFSMHQKMRGSILFLPFFSSIPF